MVKTSASGKSFPGWDDIDKDVLPEMTETYDLGSADKRWAWLFVAFAIVTSLTIGGVVKLSAVEGELFINASSTINGSLTVEENISAINISADYFFGNGSHLSSVNYTETDPFWTANRSNYVNYSSLTSFNYYNSTDFSISDYFTKSEILGFSYYNSTDFNIDDYLLESNKSLAGNYSATIDFCVASGNCLSGALTSYTETDPFWTGNYSAYNESWSSTYNATYDTWAYNQTTPAIDKILSFSYYNLTDFDINDYYLKSNPFGFYNITDFDINDYYLKSNPFGFYNSTNPQTETDPKWTGNKTNVAFTNAAEIFSANVTLNDELIMSQDKNIFMGAGNMYYNGTCMIIKGSSAEMQIC